MLGNVSLNLLVPQFPHQWSGWGEPSPSGEQFGVCALASTSAGFGSGLWVQGLAGPSRHQALQNTRNSAWNTGFVSESVIPALSYTCS